VLDCLAANPGARLSTAGVAALAERARLRKMRTRRDADAVAARPLDELAGLIAEGTLRLGEAVIELADADRAADLAALACSRTEGDPDAFLRHLFAPDETAVTAMCRVAGLDLESFSAVMRLRHRRRPIGAGDIARVLRAFQALPPAD
jgi:hypothetical protein